MKLVSQPEKSYCCGQCCVAMAAGVTLDEVIHVVGKKGSTSTKILHKALVHYGINSPSRTRLTPIKGNLSLLPDRCIIKIRLAWKKRNWHWVFKDGDTIHDPGKIGSLDINKYAKLKDRVISSYLKVNGVAL